jgi:hypothetical protein
MEGVSSKVISCDDGSLPGSAEEQRILFLEWSDFNLDRYYRFLSNRRWTIPTKFVEIEDPGMLLHVLSSTSPLSDAESQWKEALILHVDEAIGDSLSFVKLQRSPKDVVDQTVLRSTVLDALRVELAALVNRNGHSRIEEFQKMAVLKASFGRALAGKIFSCFWSVW